MLYFALFVVCLSFFIHFMHRSIGWLDMYLMISPYHSGQTASLVPILNILLLIPLLFWPVAFFLYKQNYLHPALPWLIMLSLTLGSISIIAGGNGMVEYHFSIFMVLASMAYYEKIRLIVVSSLLFALQHILGYFTAPQLICGTDNYPFTLLMMHAFFLILTSAVIIIQLIARKHYHRAVQEKEFKQAKIIKELILHVSEMSQEVLANAASLE